MEDDLAGEWITPLPLEPIPIHLGHIAHLYLAIYDLLRVFLAEIRDSASEVLPKVIYQKLERSYSSLILWSRANGVAQGELDDLLKRSKELRQVTITFLVNTGSIIAERIVPPCLSNNHVWDVSRQTRRVIKAKDEAVQSLGHYAITGDSVTQSRPPSGSFDNAVSNLKTMIQGLVDLGPILTDPLQDDEDTFSERSLELNLTADSSAIVGSTSQRLSKLVYATPQQEQKASTDAPRNSSVVKLPVMEATVKHEDSKENEPISWDDPVDSQQQIQRPQVQMQHPQSPEAPTGTGVEEKPLYLNAKQSHRILTRRVARQRFEEHFRSTSKGRIPDFNTMSRPRGPNGQFHTAEGVATLECDATKTPDGRIDNRDSDVPKASGSE